MKLGQLLEPMEALDAHADPEAEVLRAAYDSRRVEPGDLFFALPGLHHDGSAFVADALAAGAVAAVLDRPGPATGDAWVQVEEPRKALAQAAAALHGHPSRALTAVGVTGTNGKTTITYWLEAIDRQAGKPSGVVGTTGYRIDGESRTASFTTPQAPELQALLAEMVARGVESVALEISSHALVQRRAFGLEFDVVIFTNLGHDHLDYHGTLDAYLDAKLMLFDGRNHPHPRKAPVAVIHRGDPYAEQVIDAARRGGSEVRTYGLDAAADVRLVEVEPRDTGTRFQLVEGGQVRPVDIHLLGRHNALNAAAAYTAVRSLGLDAETAVRGLEALERVPGRLERVSSDTPFEVLVDFAHTPESLAHALETVREHRGGRVLLVFGCGGDRDRAKRPRMGAIAAQASDAAWVTNDNPRHEDPARIAADIVAAAPERLKLELDRRAAIAAAIAAARRGDTVLIAGKGHETTQVIGDQILPFDDRAVARELLGREHSGGR